MGKYHLGAARIPLCGARGTANRYNVICVSKREWDQLSEQLRCAKCAEKLRTTARLDHVHRPPRLQDTGRAA